MTSTSPLDENLEELNNVPYDNFGSNQPEFDLNAGENVVASAIDYGDVNEDDSNAESGSEGAPTEDTDEESENETIDAEALPDEIPIDIPAPVDTKPPAPESWPTLEILPGGVIKPTKEEDLSEPENEEPIEDKSEDMMYACAKCPQRFKFLFALVKHVRWHEDEKKREDGADLRNLSNLERELISIKNTRLQLTKKHRKQKLEIMARMAKAVGDLTEIKGLRNRRQ
ncbi:unnamed protein product [Plutella xylostella]|uniref:(diamondback moth) hypothetical protein n=1 Tax=Plutella xylostella TaxID=51655 RepID=A0A8S4EMS4_PLUXY|nr:uncharacterized protein LOC105393437 [Plutella xylostella]CAG9116227.1 unnamed protein product [Plutella xylostella]